MKSFGIAVIGSGSIADVHIKAIRELPEARLVGVFSRKESRAREVGEREGCFWTTDYKELLQRPDVDLVCLTSSSGSHAEIGYDVLAAGKHLFVEKPITMTSADAERLMREAQERGLVLSVVSQRRFEPQNRAIKRVLEQGGIGRLLLIETETPFFRSQEYYDSAEWRGTLAEDGGALMNQGIHAIDLLLWLAGAQVRTVYGKTATLTHRMEAEDIGVAVLTFEGGALGRIFASTSIVPGFASTLKLYGEKGAIWLEGNSIVHWTVPGVEQPVFEEAGHQGGGVTDPKQISGINHKRQLQNVLNSLKGQETPEVKGEDGRNAVRLIEAIYESSQAGSEVKF